MSFRLVALVAVALLAPSASAQLAAAPGPYLGLSSAAPEHVLFAGDAAPQLRAGWRLGGGVAVEVGGALHARTRPFGATVRTPAAPGDARGERTQTTRALALSATVRRPVGAFEVRSGASVGASRNAVEDRIEGRYDEALAFVPGPAVERASADAAHVGASLALAVPFERGGARMAPGLALGVATDRPADGDAATAWSASLTVPTSVAVGPVGLTLDAAVGVVRSPRVRSDRAPAWAPSVALAVRADL